MKRMIKKVSAAIFDYNMIEDGDKVAIGLSGGKDSMILLKILSHIKKYHKIKFSLCAITVDPFFNGIKSDLTEICKFCEENEVEYIIKDTRLYEIIFEIRKESNPCSLCSKMRRGILVNTAKEYGCNKIALGHHKNDAVQTFFMNLLDCGSISCFSPISHLSRKDIYVIRPLIYCEETEVKSACERFNIPVFKSLCPVDGKTERANIDQVILELKEKYSDINNKVIGAMKKSNINGW